MIETQEQALAEARRRWGQYAEATHYSHLGIYEVSISNRYTYAYAVKGIGLSWDAAFADADKREGK